MTIEYRFVQVVDTVSIRGNKLFGDAGSHGESTFPPRPSVLSGAFRSVLWANNGGNAKAIQQSPFSITSVLPARRHAQGEVEIFLPLPADLLVTDGGKAVRKLEPQILDGAILHSQIPQLPMMPILKQSKQAKPESGWLLNQAGITAYLQGEKLNETHLTQQAELWSKESRIGIGLNRNSRTADDGKLFTVEHTVPQQSENHGITAGLVVGIANGGSLPASGFIRLGGDGRAAEFSPIDAPDIQRAPKTDKFKLVLLTPSLFANGWLPDGIVEENGAYWLNLDGFKARLACAAVSRAEVVSGWDLECWKPKDAERTVPSGSVYWLDQAEGDFAALDKLVIQGFWAKTPDNELNSRRAEGYNRVLLAAW
ncbi:MAG: type III-B CRISPR module-associated Cmr3 family protein [Thiothrix sp.]